MGKTLKISAGGQVSVPAAVRKRWGTTRVVAEDHGEYVLLRPAPEDPIGAAAGAFEAEMDGGPLAADAVRDARVEDARAEESPRGRPDDDPARG